MLICPPVLSNRTNATALDLIDNPVYIQGASTYMYLCHSNYIFINSHFVATLFFLSAVKNASSPFIDFLWLVATTCNFNPF